MLRSVLRQVENTGEKTTKQQNQDDACNATMTLRLLLLIATISTCLGFAPSLRTAISSLKSPLPLFLSSQGGGQSRFEGMQREPTAADLAVIDDMITKLSDAKPYELPNAVSRAIRVVSSPQFFLRIAERVDKASTSMEKEKLSALADNLVNTIRAVVSMTEDSLNDRAKDVEKVVKAASEPESGEFLVPLSKERLDAMRTEVEGLEAEDLNEGFLTTVDSWMNKAHQVSEETSGDYHSGILAHSISIYTSSLHILPLNTRNQQKDGMDGMVTIMQKALQIYAGTVISRARIQLQANVGAALSGETQVAADDAAAGLASTDSAASSLFEKLLHVDTDSWDTEIRKGIDSEGVTKESLVSEVQKTMESVILGLENGSMGQRVQAEFLRELVMRIEAC